MLGLISQKKKLNNYRMMVKERIQMKNSSKIQQLTQKNLTRIWNNEFNLGVDKEQMQYWFGLKLYQYAAGQNYDLFIPSNKRDKITSIYRGSTLRGSSKEKQFQRLLLGYNGLGIDLTPLRSGISSEAANNSEAKTVKDHVIGVTLAGQTIANELDRRVKKDYSKLDKVQKHINRMCKDWLQHHLWLWVTCRLTYDEHSPNRLKRASKIDPGSESILDFKKNLKHYEQAGISVEEYK